MKFFGDGISERHKELQRVIRKAGGRKADALENAIQLFLDIHARLHLAEVSGGEKNEVDALLADLSPDEYAMMPSRHDETIAWVLWHTARIEDLTMNILVQGGEQVFNRHWQEKMGVALADTGNALTDAEILQLSHNLDKKALLAYRNAVGVATRQIVRRLSAEDMKRKTDPARLDRILREGGVVEHKDSVWLLEFWGGKDVAGLLLMPPTRHVLLHLNDCCKWKARIRNNCGS